MYINITHTTYKYTATDIIIEHRIVENVNEYVYLGHAIKLGKKKQTAEINRRIGLTWTAFGGLRYKLKFKKRNYPH